MLEFPAITCRARNKHFGANLSSVGTKAVDIYGGDRADIFGRENVKRSLWEKIGFVNQSKVI